MAPALVVALQAYDADADKNFGALLLEPKADLGEGTLCGSHDFISFHGNKSFLNCSFRVLSCIRNTRTQSGIASMFRRRSLCTRLRQNIRT